jgi:hypothetical protein
VRRPPDGDAGVGGAEVDADRRPVALRATHLCEAVAEAEAEAAGTERGSLFLNFGRGKREAALGGNWKAKRRPFNEAEATLFFVRELRSRRANN